MKALVKYQTGEGHLDLREVPKPQPGPGEVLLEIGAVGICGTDLHIFAGEYPVNPPVTLGHEFAGTIVALGEGVTDWTIGERVTSLPYASVCGACRYCRDGQFGLCAARLSYGSGVNGAFAEYLAVNASGIYRLPDHQDFVAGCLTEPLACVTKAVFDIGDLESGEHVVILGPGPIGLLTTQVAEAVGAHVTLIGLKSDATRLELGRSLGAEQVLFAEDLGLIEQLTKAWGENGVDVVIECSGAEPALGLALEIVRNQGRVIQIGLFGKPIKADLDLIVFKDLTVRGSFASSPTSWERALDLTRSGQVDTRRLVSDVFSLDDWQTAFTRAAEGKGLKVVVQP